MRNLKRALSLALATVMTLGLMVVGTGAVGYTDVTSEDNQEAIEVLQEVGIMTGVNDDEFDPDGLVTRNQMAVIMSQLLNLDYDYYRGINAFTDVPTWAAPYVAACVAEGVTAGIGNGLYGGENNITAAQAALMLMKALGYFQYQGDFNPDWQVATVRQASYIGLFNGVDSNADAALTRGQVAQMVLNALKSDMVYFTGTVGTELTLPDGTKYTAGYVSEYSSRTSTDNKYNTLVGGKTDISNQGQYYIQLGEELYDGDLRQTSTTDAFDRPATTWRYDNEVIGTYTDEADMTYTAEVKISDIYKDLGLSRTVSAANVTFHRNGNTEAASGNDNSATPVALNTLDLARGTANKIGGNGILTEVFYDADNGTAVITLIETYAGKVTAVHDTTSTYDAYISIAPAVSGVGQAGTFETEADYAVDDIVLYTRSAKSGEGIQTVVPAEIITGTVNGYTEFKSITVDGNPYSAAKVYAGELDDMDGAIGYEVDLVMDQYGYVLKVDTDKASSNYAVILSHDANAVDGGRAKLLFTDGTTEVVNLKDTTIADYSDSYTSAAPVLSDNDIVRYVVDGNGKYTLTLIGDAGTTGTSVTPVTKGTAVPGGNTYANYEDHLSQRDLANSFNGKTIFLVKSTSGTSTVYNAYTGIANVPTIAFAGTAGVQAIYAKTLNATNNTREQGPATVVYIDATASGATVNASSKDVVFVKGSTVGRSYDADLGFYYEYDAIVNGSFEKIQTVTRTTIDTLYSTVNYDSNGVASLSNGVRSGSATYGDTVNGARYGTGTDVEANGSIGLMSSYYTYADDCQVFYKDADGNMMEYSISSIAEDTNDNVFVKFTDGEVSTIVIVQVPEGGAGGGDSSYSVGTAFELKATPSKIEFTAGSVVDQDSSPATIAGDLTVTVVVKAWTGNAWETFTTAVDDTVNITSGAVQNLSLATGLTNGTTYQFTATLTGDAVGSLILFSGTRTVVAA